MMILIMNEYDEFAALFIKSLLDKSTINRARLSTVKCDFVVTCEIMLVIRKIMIIIIYLIIIKPWHFYISEWMTEDSEMLFLNRCL